MGKKFNIKKAETGFEVETKSGQPAKILLFDRDSKYFPLVVTIDNKKVVYYTTEGKFYKDKNSDNDLVMK
jgi:hypothetical protein